MRFTLCEGRSPGVGVKALFIASLFSSQFLPNVCKQIKGHTKPDAYAVSLIKGLSEKEDGSIELVSDMIRKSLNCSTAVLMGANLAHEVSKEYYCEATVGCSEPEKGQELKKIMQVSFLTDM